MAPTSVRPTSISSSRSRGVSRRPGFPGRHTQGPDRRVPGVPARSHRRNDRVVRAHCRPGTATGRMMPSTVMSLPRTSKRFRECVGHNPPSRGESIPAEPGPRSSGRPCRRGSRSTARCRPLPNRPRRWRICRKGSRCALSGTGTLCSRLRPAKSSVTERDLPATRGSPRRRSRREPPHSTGRSPSPRSRVPRRRQVLVANHRPAHAPTELRGPRTR